MAKQQYLECGKAVSTHGVRGTLRLESWCDTPETLARLRTLYRKTAAGFVPMKVRAASVQKNMVLVSFEELTTLEGEKYGTLREVISPGGRDVYVVDDVRGGGFMIPAVKEFVKEIVTEGEREGIYVSLIEGMRE